MLVTTRVVIQIVVDTKELHRELPLLLKRNVALQNNTNVVTILYRLELI